MRLLLVMFIHIANANLATLSLFAEKGDKVVAKSTERIRVSLEARIPLTQTELLKSILAAQIVGQEWGNLTAFEGVTPFSTQFKMALEPGLAIIDEMKALATRLYSYTAASEYATPSNCTLNFTLVEGGHFEQGVKHIITARAGLSIVGVPADLMANKDLLRKISDFSLSYNGLARDWKGDLDLALPILNNLAQGTFPDSLRGKLEVLPCLSAQGSNFEKIEVRSCTARNRQYTCELTVAEPILVSTYTELLPLLYEASSLKIEDGAYLIRDKVTNKIGTLKCKGTDPITALQLCRLETGILPPPCLESLEGVDLDSAILYCPYSTGQSPIGIRIANEGILIQGEGLSIMEGPRAVLQRPPLLIFSNEVVKISSLERELIFKPTIKVENPRIETSSLTKINIAAIQLKKYYANWREYAFSSEALNYLSLLLEAVFAPLTLVGLCLSCRKRFARPAAQRQRRENYDENIIMLANRPRNRGRGRRN